MSLVFDRDEDVRSFEEMTLDEIENQYARKVKFALFLTFGLGLVAGLSLMNAFREMDDMAETMTDGLDAVVESQSRREHRHGFLEGLLTQKRHEDTMRAAREQSKHHPQSVTVPYVQEIVPDGAGG